MEESSLPRIPRPTLAAVLLITSSRAGPRLVLHYPPEPSHQLLARTSSPSSTDAATHDSDRDGASSSAGSSDEDSEAEGQGDDDRVPVGPGTSLPPPSITASELVASPVATAADASTGLSSPPPSRRLGAPSLSTSSLAGVAAAHHAHTPSVPFASPSPAGKPRPARRARADAQPPSPDSLDRLFGVSHDGLAKLLAPGGGRRAWSGKRLEVQVRGRTFLGCPVFVGEGRRRRRRKDDGLNREDEHDEEDGDDDEKTESDEDDDDDDDEHMEIGGTPSRRGTRPQTRPPKEDDTSSPTLSKTTTNSSTTRPQAQASVSTSSVPVVTTSTNTPAARPGPQPRTQTSQAPLASTASFSASTTTSSGSGDSRRSASPAASSLTMFNLVLVLAPPPPGSASAGADADATGLAFEHIARPLAVALRDAQRDGWLDAEVRDAERWAGEWRAARERGRAGTDGSGKGSESNDGAAESKNPGSTLDADTTATQAEDTPTDAETHQTAAKPSALAALDAYMHRRSALHRLLATLHKALASNDVALLDLATRSRDARVSNGQDHGSSGASATLALQMPRALNVPRAPRPGEILEGDVVVSSAALTVAGRRWVERRRAQVLGLDTRDDAMRRKKGGRLVFLDDEDDDANKEGEEDGRLDIGRDVLDHMDVKEAQEVDEEQEKEPSLLDLYDAARIDTTAPQSISPHAALLLLLDASDLLAQLQPLPETPSKHDTPSKDHTQQPPSQTHGPLTPMRAPHPLAAPLAYMISALTPRRTLAQLVRLHLPGLTLADVCALSCLLIRLRAARAIPPLHASGVFVVDPGADLGRAAPGTSASTEFVSRFCTDDVSTPIPSLPTLLARLTAGAAWASVIPAKTAKSRYMDVLAWLVRERFVVQMRTFAWVYASRSVRQAVAAELADELHLEQQEDTAISKQHAHTYEHAHADHSRDLLMAAIDSKRHARPPSEAGSSTGSVHTTVRAGTPLGERGAEWRDAEHLHEGVLRSPTRGGRFETACAARVGAGLEGGEEAQRAWGRMLRYLDGETAIEEIAGIEGLKRKAVAALVGGWVAEGVVRVVRHW